MSVRLLVPVDDLGSRLASRLPSRAPLGPCRVTTPPQSAAKMVPAALTATPRTSPAVPASVTVPVSASEEGSKTRRTLEEAERP